MKYPRNLSQKILQLAGFYPAVVVTGARQSGKTTLLRELFPQYNYVSLDSVPDALLAEESPGEFLQRFSPPVLIDEIQYAPKLFRHLKIQIDKNRELKGQFILTGSQNFSLMKEVSESLAGRVGILELENLSVSEIGKDLEGFIREHSIEEMMARGFFPELWKEQEFPYPDFYRSYIATYLERDVRQIIKVNSLREFDRFLRTCAARSGDMVNKTGLAGDIGVSSKTLSGWLRMMETSNQITLLEPYFSNIGKRLVKTSKLYLNDCGLLCYLLGLGGKVLSQYQRIGNIWETFVFGELRKILHTQTPQAKLWFYRDQSAKEVDFLLEAGGKIHLLEVKWTQIPSRQHCKQLKEVEKVLKEKVGKKFVICRCESSFPLGDGIVALNGLNLKEELHKAIINPDETI